MAGGWRTDLNDFAIDLLMLIEEQIALAQKDPVAHQRATVAECAGAITCLKKRLAEDEFEHTQAMLTYESIYTGNWLDDWEKLATAPIPKFEEGMSSLLDGARRLRAHFERKSELEK